MNDPINPPVPRDSFAWRWIKFISVIVFPALVLGVGFLFYDLILQGGGKTAMARGAAKERFERDTTEAARNRFIIGVCVGGGLGALYVVRCLIRNEDP